MHTTFSSKHYMGPTPVYGARAEKPFQNADFAMKQTNICRLSGDINYSRVGSLCALRAPFLTGRRQPTCNFRPCACAVQFYVSLFAEASKAELPRRTVVIYEAIYICIWKGFAGTYYCTALESVSIIHRQNNNVIPLCRHILIRIIIPITSKFCIA